MPNRGGWRTRRRAIVARRIDEIPVAGRLARVLTVFAGKRLAISHLGLRPVWAHVPLFQRAPARGADGVLAFLKGREVGFDAARVAVLLHRLQYALGGADRGAVGLRGVDAKAEAHAFEFAGAEHRRLAALEDVDERRPLHLAADDAPLV